MADPNILMSLLQKVGNVMDTPGRMVRTGLSNIPGLQGLEQGGEEFLSRQGDDGLQQY